MSAAPGHLRLEVISGNAPGSTLVVEDELEIGRHATGAGRLSEDEEISRHHARISHEATGNYAIEDLGSSNGTFVNGLRIRAPPARGGRLDRGGGDDTARAGDRAGPSLPARAPRTPRLAITMEIDFAAREARIAARMRRAAPVYRRPSIDGGLARESPPDSTPVASAKRAHLGDGDRRCAMCPWSADQRIIRRESHDVCHMMTVFPASEASDLMQVTPTRSRRTIAVAALARCWRRWGPRRR